MKHSIFIFSIFSLTLCSLASSCDRASDTTGAPIRFFVNETETKSAPIIPGNIASTMAAFYSETFLASGTSNQNTPAKEAPFNGEDRQKAALDPTATAVVDEYNTQGTWPADREKAFDFWSYGPAGAFENLYPDYSGDHKTMSFTISPVHNEARRSDAKDQYDVVAGFTGNKKYGDLDSDHLVPVTFKHTMAGIRIKVGKIDGNFANPNKIKITGISISGLYGKGKCSVTSTGTVSWSNVTSPASYLQTFNDGYIALQEGGPDSDGNYLSGVYLDSGATDATFGGYSVGTNIPFTTTIGDEVFMVIPQTIPSGATVTVDWSMYDNTEEKDIAYASRTATLTSMEIKSGYLYTFTIDLKKKDSVADIDVTLTQILPWEYVSTVIDYSHVVQMNNELSFSNCVVDGDTVTFLEGYPDICGQFRVESPQGAAFLVRLMQDFDAFEVVIDPSTQVIANDGHYCKFYLRPRVNNPERDYIATIQISVRCADERVINIDDMVQYTTQYKILLPKVN